jgi:NADPH-dependent 2,4-dienoyl-CoA reductase/sulfur reductase-like enzyme
VKRKVQDESLEMKQEPDMSPVVVDSELNAVNGSQKEQSPDVRSVLIVGAGPAGLMLAYAYPV